LFTIILRLISKIPSGRINYIASGQKIPYLDNTHGNSRGFVKGGSKRAISRSKI
jgi:hypothetical protein